MLLRLSERLFGWCCGLFVPLLFEFDDEDEDDDEDDDDEDEDDSCLIDGGGVS